MQFGAVPTATRSTDEFSMLNRYSLWKNLMILGVVLFGFYYAAPNLYAPDPALQIGGASGSQTM